MGIYSKYICPCCGYRTLDESPPGTYDICPICYWEDDYVQYHDPAFTGGANVVSLSEARNNFSKYKVIELRFRGFVREPNEEEILEKNMRTNVI